MSGKETPTHRDKPITVDPPQCRDRSLSASNNYEIIVASHLDEHWSEWFGVLTITHDIKGNTCLSGEIPDQAALYGILAQIRDLGLPLVSLRRITF